MRSRGGIGFDAAAPQASIIAMLREGARVHDMLWGTWESSGWPRRWIGVQNRLVGWDGSGERFNECNHARRTEHQSQSSSWRSCLRALLLLRVFQ